MYTVTQLARLAGITARTLHYYDQIGLLSPSRVGANGYRYYSEESLLRLQQILFYRELDLPLAEIRGILARPGFDVLAALRGHRQALQRRAGHIQRLLQTVDDTILHLQGEKEMSEKQLFQAFSDEEQAALQKEAEQTYDPATVRASAQKWQSYSAAEKERIGAEGNAAYAEIAAAIPLGAGSPQAQAGVEHWRRHMESFWTPSLEQLQALAEGYCADPRFKANFDRVDPRLAEFMREAVRIYVQKHEIADC